MNKFSYILLGAAAVAMASCSNDEPAPGPGNTGSVHGDVAYLNIKISSADNATGRAAGDPFGYEFGVTEQTIDNAWFYFYDEDGNYMLNTNQLLSKNGDEDPNIEWKSGNTLIIDGLEGKNYPNWVVTVLNRPAGFEAPRNIMDWTAISNWDSYYTTSAGEKRFTMVTSSYLGEDNTPFYFATKLEEKNFMQETPDREDYKDDPDNRVNIYVERLAARVQVKTTLTGATQFTYNGESGVMYPTELTVGGEENPGAETKLYVSFGGWALNSTAKTSHPAKDLGEWTAMTQFGDKNWMWNDPDYFRSYWGKSVTYGKSGDALKALLNAGTQTWEGLAQQVGNDGAGINSSVEYCNENTNEINNITGTGDYADPNKATHVLLKATVRDENGAPLDLVQFRGVTYLKSNFIDYALSVADMPYATRTLKETVNVKDAEGNDLAIDIYEYTTLGSENFSLALAGNGTGSVNVVVNEGEYWNPGVLVTETYTWQDESNQTVTKTVSYHKNAVKASKATIDTTLKGIHAGGNKAIAATSGAVYYPIVIEHLNFEYKDGKKVAEKVIAREGQVGVVRNHAYTINVTKINTLGEGVFKPTTEGGDSAETIVPDGPKTPTYYVESYINVLSWKLVEQEEEI